MTSPELPPGLPIEFQQPAASRRYDTLLGGKDNLAPDRESADRLSQELPSIAAAAQELRRFLQRAVHYLAKDCGVRQFLDIGCGLPFAPNVHEIAQAVDTRCRVVYVDSDLVVGTHARAWLTSHPDGFTEFVDGSVENIDAVLANPAVRQALDFTEPVAVLLLAVLHFVPAQQQVDNAVQRLRAALGPGSYLAMSHVTFDPLPADQAERLTKLGAPGAGHGPFRARTHTELTALLAGLDPVPPGLVSVVNWHPDRHPRPEITPEQAVAYGVIARTRS